MLAVAKGSQVFSWSNSQRIARNVLHAPGTVRNSEGVSNDTVRIPQGRYSLEYPYYPGILDKNRSRERAWERSRS